MSSEFSQLVDSAQEFLPLLPWGVEFEKDKFLRPDFTSLDVVSFGIPADDEIRQNEGFKNVSLGNVLSAASQDKRVTFLTTEDQVNLFNYNTKEIVNFWGVWGRG
uniref:Uncharacterized protein n=1 Tax=Amphimedon queenslandica TaxID=400682 RepID=A0A1X7SJJ1_AMPQE